MKLETAFDAHIGGRDEQQDRVDVLSSANGAERLLVLADGMGGHAGGSLAAEAVVAAARAEWEEFQSGGEGPDLLLKRIVESAHAAINRIGAEKKLQPRSTIVLLFLTAQRAVWAHIGDSRLYHFRDGRLLHRTRDHSVVQMLVDLGKIKESEMGTHPDQNRLTQSIGGDTDPEPEVGAADLAAGDAFLLCSDGLWEMLSAEEMATALSGGSLAKLVRDMPALAYERAGKGSDNISLAVARVGDARVAPVGVSEKSGGGLRKLAYVGASVAAIALAAVIVRPWERTTPDASPQPPAAASPGTAAEPPARGAKRELEKPQPPAGRPEPSVTPSVREPDKPQPAPPAALPKPQPPAPAPTQPPAAQPAPAQPAPAQPAPAQPSPAQPAPDPAPQPAPQPVQPAPVPAKPLPEPGPTAPAPAPDSGKKQATSPPKTPKIAPVPPGDPAPAERKPAGPEPKTEIPENKRQGSDTKSEDAGKSENE